MTDKLVIAIAQCNPTLGDIQGNLAMIRAIRAKAAAGGADLVVFTELVICGYPPEDLVLKPRFQEKCREALEALAADTNDGGPAAIVGCPWVEAGKIYNAAFLLDGGAIMAKRFKHDLPNYGVFDEKRVFAPGPLPGPVVFRGVRLGLLICEDMWTPDAAECLHETGAEILIVPNGSPYEIDKPDERMNYAVARVKETGLPLIYVNQVGGQDELVFDGASFILNADCSLPIQMAEFSADLAFTTWSRTEKGWYAEVGARASPLPALEGIWQAMQIGLRDYVRKNKFPSVLLGMSGGIDSAVTAAVAVDALGADKVNLVMLPYLYTSDESLQDAAECARRLGARYQTVPIEPAVSAFATMLKPAFDGRKTDITEENIQSRARGLTLMALSNKFGHLVLTTGNKSENSVGYATLYGDMCGGFNVLKDVYKTTVFDLARWRNMHLPRDSFGPAAEVIPPRIIQKPPSAELRPDQRDQDSLPPYDQLDRILRGLIEEERSVRQIVAAGEPADVVERIQHLLYVAEYKRRQAAPGVKITRKSFGRERRYPITNAFRDSYCS